MYKIIGSNLGHKFQPIGLKGFPQRYIKIFFNMFRHAGMKENIKIWEFSNTIKKKNPEKLLIIHILNHFLITLHMLRFLANLVSVLSAPIYSHDFSNEGYFVFLGTRIFPSLLEKMLL